MIMAIGNSDEEVSRTYWMIRSVYMLQCALDDFDDYQALIHNTQSQYTVTAIVLLCEPLKQFSKGVYLHKSVLV